MLFLIGVVWLLACVLGLWGVKHDKDWAMGCGVCIGGFCVLFYWIMFFRGASLFHF